MHIHAHPSSATSGRCTSVEDSTSPTCQLQSSVPAKTVHTCQLQSVPVKSVRTCQLQTIESTTCATWDRVKAADAVCDTTLGTDWSVQDVAVLSLLLYHWQEAKDIQATKQPMNLKFSALVKILQSKWKPCRVKLSSGQHVRKVRKDQYNFDGRSLLELVKTYRSNPKGRIKFLSHVRYMACQYYDSVPEAFQPADRDMPIHLYWCKAATTFRPQKVRRQLFRQVKETEVDPIQK